MLVSLITSLYRSADHLPIYIDRLTRVGDGLRRRGIAFEVVIVANDATPDERDLLATLARPEVLVIHTERETLYASWNRGVRASSGDVIGFWNVDDERTVEGIAAACDLCAAGAELVDLPYDMVHRDGRHERVTALYDPARVSPKRCVGTFFMFARGLYEAAGPFDARFRIAGDFEWGGRQRVRQAIYRTADVVGGRFHLHAANLSNGTHPREWVEINTVLLWHGDSEQVRPVEPGLMRELWRAWGHTGADLPDDLQAWLWGPGAAERYRRYWRERNAPPWRRRLRLALARRGLVHSTEWHAHHRPKTAHTIQRR